MRQSFILEMLICQPSLFHFTPFWSPMYREVHNAKKINVPPTRSTHIHNDTDM